MKRFLLPALLVLVSFAPEMIAQWSSNPAGNTPVCQATRNQRWPAMVSDGNGGVIIAWEDERPAVNLTDIYAQRLDANGKAMWTTDGIVICKTPGSQNRPLLVSDGKGGAYVMWKDVRYTQNDIFSQRIDSTGKLLWSSDGVNLVPVAVEDKEQSDIVAVSDGSGGAIFAFMDNTAGGNSDNQLMVGKVDENGGQPWGEAYYFAPIPASSGPYEYSPTICSDGAGGAIILFQYFSGSGNDLYAQHIAADGSSTWGAAGAAICTEPGIQYPPVIASDGLGGAFAAWPDDRTSTQGVYATRFNGSGSVVWGSSHVSTAGGRQDRPAVCGMGAGGGVVVWEDSRGGNSDIYAQYYDASGSAKWTANGVPVCTAGANQIVPTVRPDGNGGVIIAWEDRRNGNTNADIYTQHLSATGQPLWAANGVAVSSAVKSQSTPVMLVSSAGDAVFVWEDYRVDFTNGNIFAQKIMADGSYPRSQPQALLTSKTADFGVVAVGGKKDKVISISNVGGDPLQVTSVTSTNPAYTASPTTSTVTAGNSFDLTIRFSPTVTGPTPASVIVHSNSWTSPDTIRVTGNGTGTAILALASKTVPFGAVKVGLKLDSTVLFSNNGLDTLKITAMSASNSAFTAPTQVMSIPPGGSQSAILRFSPKAIGKVNARFLIVSNSLQSPDTLFVNGTGFGDVEILVSPDRITFGKAPVGINKDTVISIKNNGNDSLRVTEIISDESSFQALPTRFTVGPGATYPLTIRFTPNRMGSISGELLMYCNSVTNPDKIVVGGTGIQDVAFSVNNVNFGSVSIGTSHDTLVTITNKRSDTLRITDITSTAPAFTCTQTTLVLAPGADTKVTLRFTPTNIGLVNGQISFVSNSSSSPDRIAVNGEGLQTNAMGELAGAIARFELGKNFPNPFTAGTVIPFILHQTARVQLTVENVLGQRVATLTDQELHAGNYRPRWSANGMPAGLYRAVLRVDNATAMRSMLLVR